MKTHRLPQISLLCLRPEVPMGTRRWFDTEYFFAMNSFAILSNALSSESWIILSMFGSREFSYSTIIAGARTGHEVPWAGFFLVKWNYSTCSKQQQQQQKTRVRNSESEHHHQYHHHQHYHHIITVIISIIICSSSNSSSSSSSSSSRVMVEWVLLNMPKW